MLAVSSREGELQGLVADEPVFSTAEMAGVGILPGLPGAGFGQVGEARATFNSGQGHDQVEGDLGECGGRPVERQEVRQGALAPSDVGTKMFRATGCMFEQEHLLFINMVAAAGNGGTGGGGGGFRYPRSVMENIVIQNLRQVLVQAMAPKVHHGGGVHEEIIHQILTSAQKWRK